MLNDCILLVPVVIPLCFLHLISKYNMQKPTAKGIEFCSWTTDVKLNRGKNCNYQWIRLYHSALLL